MALKDYRLENRWGPASEAEKVTATRARKRYQLKRYMTPPYPAGEDVSNPNTKRKIAACKALLTWRKHVNEMLKTADGGQGMLAYATDVFLNTTLDAPGVIEAVPFVEGAKDLDFVRGDGDRLNSAMIGCAQCLVRLHAAGIVHADIKPENYLFIPSGAGGRTMRAVLIDFDRSYEPGNVPGPDRVGGSVGYIAPEVVAYFNDEDCDEDGRDSVYYPKLGSTARDIYSLGVLYHMMLTGALPRAEGGRAAVDRSVVTAGYLGDLLEAMLSTDPADRPTATDVLDTLTSGRLSFKFEAYEALWPEHAEIYGYVATDRFSRIRRLNDGGSHRYMVYYPNGITRDYTIQMMANLGVVKRGGGTTGTSSPTGGVTGTDKDTTYEEGLLWPEDEAFTIDMEMVRRRGYTAIYRVNRNGTHTYAVRRATGETVERSRTVLQFEKCMVKR